jgi:hypothetical protein
MVRGFISPHVTNAFHDKSDYRYAGIAEIPKTLTHCLMKERGKWKLPLCGN